jgi:hypothetical protein
MRTRSYDPRPCSLWLVYGEGRLLPDPERALYANMGETLPPSEFKVEGGEGMRDEYPA